MLPFVCDEDGGDWGGGGGGRWLPPSIQAAAPVADPTLQDIVWPPFYMINVSP